MEQMDKALKKVAGDIKKVGSNPAKQNKAATSSSARTLGDPNCPICHGVGFIAYDVEISDPRFGRMNICPCRQQQVLADKRDQLYKDSNLEALANLTFDSFNPRGRVGLGRQQADSLEQAFNQAQNFTGTLDGWLLLLGRYGCGKTHLAAAIANQAVAMGMDTLFLTVPDMLDWLRFTYAENSEIGF